MITVSLPDSPLRLVPGAVWRFVVPTWLSCGVVSPFSPGGFWKGCVAKLPAINPDSTKFYYPIWLSSRYSNSTRDRFSLQLTCDPREQHTFGVLNSTRVSIRSFEITTFQIVSLFKYSRSRFSFAGKHNTSVKCVLFVSRTHHHHHLNTSSMNIVHLDRGYLNKETLTRRPFQSQLSAQLEWYDSGSVAPQSLSSVSVGLFSSPGTLTLTTRNHGAIFSRECSNLRGLPFSQRGKWFITGDSR